MNLLPAPIAEADLYRLPLLLDRHQVVTLTGLSRNRIYTLTRAGVLRTVRPVSRTRVKWRRAEVLALIGYPQPEPAVALADLSRRLAACEAALRHFSRLITAGMATRGPLRPPTLKANGHLATPPAKPPR